MNGYLLAAWSWSLREVMFDFLIGIVVSLLPAPYREWWNEHLEAAMVSGLLEMVGSVTLLFARYVQFISQSMASM